MNYVDAQIRLSAAELNLGDARFAPAAIDAVLGSGVLKAAFSHLGVYGGEAEGELRIDATSGNPAFTLSTDLNGVRALPLLSGLADFDKLDGRMQAKIARARQRQQPARHSVRPRRFGFRQFPGRRAFAASTSPR